MNIRSSVHGCSLIGLAAFLAGCSQRPAAPAYPEDISYRQDGEIVVYTPAGISVHDAQLRGTQGSISLDREVGGLLKDEPFTFSLADDGQVAAVGFSNTVDRDVVIYDLATGHERSVLDLDLPSGFPVQQVALDPTGARVFVRADNWGMFDTETGERLWGASPDDLCCGLSAPIFSRDGQVLFGFQGTRLEARWALTGEVLFSVESGAPPGGGGVLAHSGLEGVLVGTRGDPTSPESDGGPGQEYVFWSERDGSVVKAVPQFPDRTFAPTFDGSKALACSPSGDVCASSVTLPQELRQLPGDNVPSLSQPVYSVLIWKSDGTLLQELPTFASSLSFSPDGSHLAIAASEAQLYRVEDGALERSLQYTYDSY
jgi:hypothetical protein